MPAVAAAAATAAKARRAPLRQRLRRMYRRLAPPPCPSPFLFAPIAGPGVSSVCGFGYWRVFAFGGIQGVGFEGWGVPPVFCRFVFLRAAIVTWPPL